MAVLSRCTTDLRHCEGMTPLACIFVHRQLDAHQQGQQGDDAQPVALTTRQLAVEMQARALACEQPDRRASARVSCYPRLHHAVFCWSAQ